MYYRVAGVNALIIYFGELIDECVSREVLAYYQKIKALKPEGIIEVIPSYTTLYLEFDLLLHTHESLYGWVAALKVETAEESDNQRRGIIEIPTYYGLEVGLDLERVAEERGMSVSEVIQLHSNKVYKVYTIGFAPGFAYMGSVDRLLETSRLATPRAKVPKGSVAIANAQCAVYPLTSPGGWNILGRTPLAMFSHNIEGLSYLKPGDSVKFAPVTKEHYLSMGGTL